MMAHLNVFLLNIGSNSMQAASHVQGQMSAVATVVHFLLLLSVIHNLGLLRYIYVYVVIASISILLLLILI